MHWQQGSRRVAGQHKVHGRAAVNAAAGLLTLCAIVVAEIIVHLHVSTLPQLWFAVAFSRLSALGSCLVRSLSLFNKIIA